MASSNNPGNPKGSPSEPTDQNTPSLWSKVGFKLVRFPQGKYSPRADERCLTYCSQTANGRMEKQEPWCRTICIRRVFAHEVQKTIKRNNYNDSNEPTQEYVKYPLPPEGQRTDEMHDGELESDQYERKLREGDVKYWEEGWYLWYSKSRWAAQEKLELMMHDLPVHANWYRHMSKQRSDWERESRGKNDLGDWEPPTMRMTPPRHPFNDPSKQSILVHLTPYQPAIFDRMKAVLEPTYKLMTMFHESFESGAQREFAGLMWEKARTREPWVLAQNVLVKMWKLWRKDDEED